MVVSRVGNNINGNYVGANKFLRVRKYIEKCAGEKPVKKKKYLRTYL